MKKNVSEPVVPKVVKADVSDPYVKVYVGKRRIVKTQTIMDDLNPVWNASFYVNVCDYAETIKFECRDFDTAKKSDHLGTHHLSVGELVKYDTNTRKPQRVGIERTVVLDNKESHGTLEYYIGFVPCSMLKSMDVQGVYFKSHPGNDVKLYVNADDGVEGTPVVTYGGIYDKDKVWKPQRLWRDIYDTICGAQHVIYITGLSVHPEKSLLRGNELEEAEGGKYSPYLGKLLVQKAEEGVRVNMLVWDDPSTAYMSRQILKGVTGYNDEESKAFFMNTKVNFRLVPMQGDKTNSLMEKMQRKFLLFTHHQKSIILDVPCRDDVTKREPMAFVGGVDLTNGRWDNRKHPLFRSLQTDHKDDFYSTCFQSSAEVGPRQPWHDIHCCVRGPGVLDVLENFKERWSKQATNDLLKLVDIHKLSLSDPPKSRAQDQWHTQLFRSIDARTAYFCEHHLNNFQEENENEVDELLKTSFTVSTKTIEGEGGDMTSRSFMTSDMKTFKFIRDLNCKKGRDVDASVHAGLVHHIRRARHHIYMESQYFMGSSHLWASNKKVKCGNLIPAEILAKICEKISKDERFMAYILLPMFPEGVPESKPTQELLRWQRLTMEAMYTRIAAALKRHGSHEHPTDYLNFYCLGTRETSEFSQSSKPTKKDSAEDRLNNTRRHQIYVHSKMMIVDDEVVITGSANINERSLDGTRDSELMLASYQPMNVSTSDSIPYGEVHGFRLHCWATITGKMDDVFRIPNTLECVRALNRIAEENWDLYMQEKPCDMYSHLMPFPIDVYDDGIIETRRDLRKGYFPDTQAKVEGSCSVFIPDYASC